MRITYPPLPPISLFDLNEDPSCKMLLVRDLHLLTPQDILPNRVVIQGDVDISSNNLNAFALLNSKDIKIRGNFTCNTPPLSKFLNLEKDPSGTEVFCFLPKSLKVKGDMNFSKIDKKFLST